MRPLLPFCLAFGLLALPPLTQPVHAVGSDDDEPEATQTTTTCADGQIWELAKQTCINPEDDGVDNDARYAAVRELAYAGKAEEALRVLDAMTEGDTDRVLAYRGFVLRKAGQMEASLAAYAVALERNPDNLMARAYLGFAYVELGNLDLARAELTEIAARGGAGSRAETALAHAIETGETENY